MDLLNKFLQWDPKRRITAEVALTHPYFGEDPRPKPAEMFPTFPSKGAQERKKRAASPGAPIAVHGGGRYGDNSDSSQPDTSVGGHFTILAEDNSNGLFSENSEKRGAGFQLRVA